MSNSIHDKIADAMPPLSHLECSTCHKKEEVGSVAERTANGWPKCCGYTMMLITQRQLDEAKS